MYSASPIAGNVPRLYFRFELESVIGISFAPQAEMRSLNIVKTFSDKEVEQGQRQFCYLDLRNFFLILLNKNMKLNSTKY